MSRVLARHWSNLRVDSMSSHILYNCPREFPPRYPGLPDCGELPEDGNGVPEQVRRLRAMPFVVLCLAFDVVLIAACQSIPTWFVFRTKFWNCAEIKIRKSSDNAPAASDSDPDDALQGPSSNGGRPSQGGNTSDGSESTGSDESNVGPTPPPEEIQSPTTDMILTSSGTQVGFSPDVFSDMSDALENVKEEIDSKLFLYQTPDLEWEPSSVYRYEDFSESLNVMATEGVAGKRFYIGESAAENGHVYGLVNIAAFLAQSMKET
jgi:hypothetical protein